MKNSYLYGNLISPVMKNSSYEEEGVNDIEDLLPIDDLINDFLNCNNKRLSEIRWQYWQKNITKVYFVYDLNRNLLFKESSTYQTIVRKALHSKKFVVYGKIVGIIK